MKIKGGKMEQFLVNNFQINQDGKMGFVAEIEFKGTSLSDNIVDTAHSEPVLLDIKGSPKYVLIELSHILDIENIHIIPEDRYTYTWDGSGQSVETVDFYEGIRIDGVIKSCKITEDKDDLAKWLI